MPIVEQSERIVEAINLSIEKEEEECSKKVEPKRPSTGRKQPPRKMWSNNVS